MMMIRILGVVCFLLPGISLALLAGAVVVALRRMDRRLGAVELLVLLGVFGLFSALLLRPHEHTFQSLDASGYRLMARALAQGRPMCGTDTALLAVPPGLRPALLYRPLGEFRRTRDKSFQIESLETGRTKLFFYPLLPLGMIGFDALVPGEAREFLVPVIGLLFVFVLLAAGFDRAGLLGVLGAGALLLVTPLPAWFLRGCFPESVGAVLVALALLSWHLRGPALAEPPLAAFFALGLAVSFHPVFVVLSVPACGLLLLSVAGARRRLVSPLLAFVSGLLPLLVMTLTVAAPYGGLRWSVLTTIVARSPAIRATVVAGCGLAVVFGALLLMQPWWRRFFPLRGRAWRVVVAVAVLCLWVAPTLVVVRFWRDGPAVRAGLFELREALRVPGMALCGLGGLALLISRREGRALAATVCLLAVLPVFLYLKGWDQLGMWSQRRLLPVVLVGMALLVPALAGALRFLTRGAFLRRTRVAVVWGAVLAAGMIHAVRWPAPYLVRYDRGADGWVARLAAGLGDGVYVFDYHAHSIPFAVSGRGRVFGLARHGQAQLDGVAAWMAERAGREPVAWVTAYANPGLEDGVILQEEGASEVSLPRVRCKRAFPAERDEADMALRFLRLCPVPADAVPSCHKVFDGGPLGLRGPWGRADVAIVRDDGTRLPAQWSREGSAVLGPVPRPGGTVRLTLRGDACRRDGRTAQTLRIAPPWDAEPAELIVSNGFCTASVEWTRLATTNAVSGLTGPRTGCYTLTAAYPYNPRAAGIRGFASDLGVLVHDLRIEAVEAAGSGAD